MKTYVGTAKIEPLSRTPRKLPSMMSRMNPIPSGIVYDAGTPVDITASTPAETLTDTVRM